MPETLPSATEPKPPRRRFWMRMEYTCTHCGHRVPFFLEEGCEGPRRGTRYVRTADHAGLWPTTGDGGRLIVPVPFIAGGCPVCQPTHPWDLNLGVLQHGDWSTDTVFNGPRYESEITEQDGRFLYPEGDVRQKVNGQLPCGVPELAAWGPRP